MVRLTGLGAVLLAMLAVSCAHDPQEPPPPPPATRHAAPVAAPKPMVHVVRPGETVWRISRRYGVGVEDVIRANGIRDVRAVPVGARLRIPKPVSRRVAAGNAPDPGNAVRRKGQDGVRRVAEISLRWPLRGTVTSGFGGRNGRSHQGIDISAPRGSHVRAAEAGRVIHSGRGLSAYGKVVIVKHVGSYKTVYAHNRRNLVRKGEFVEKGQLIAEVGSTGNASGPHLHFEVRRGNRAVNPRRYLP